ncbi:hypothetical protein GF327_06350 [Candidatus Woesearchaeota archaeon]|nr:hypothetical protein [Candidatus Woesearchaeota archaeon]
MEKYQELKKKALRCIAVADHMLTMTYPLVEDPKLLVAVIENIFLGITNIMGALLYYERIYKRVPAFSDTFESKFNIFKKKCIKRYDINRNYLNFMLEVKEIVAENKKSPLTFSRKDKFVICSDNYRLKTLSVDDLKTHLEKAKLFIHEICSIIDKNERIFSESKRRT